MAIVPYRYALGKVTENDAVQTLYTYDPFGMTTASAHADTNPYLFVEAGV